MIPFDDARTPQIAPASLRVRAAAVRAVHVPTPPAAAPAPLEMGDPDSAPEGIRLTTRYVTRDGIPWIPVMGEYHFSRDLPENWERELRKMKAGGIDVLATYMLWIAHEETRGALRWDGRRDIRRFIETAARVGLKVMLRIGPWAHGESRNGGFPDWLQALPIRHRSNDPAYLELARSWYRGIESQVRGLFHTPDAPEGPIIGIQVDNELYGDGPHLATLREIAESVGMRASLWTATGWGGAEIPRGRVLPVYAGYSDGFWEESETGWPDFGAMHFSYSTVRDDLTVGADLRSTPVEGDRDSARGADDPWPFVTCELGGGMAVAYHRRPLVDPDDVAALALTKVGSGSAWQGYYMYHGGLQMPGALSSVQESQATGYPNDVPVRDYDFFAPLGSAGSPRPHFHKLRQQHLFLDAFGGELAPAPTTIPGRSERDVRWAVRGDGERGFLFVNNHQPAVAALPAVDDVQFSVDFATQSTVTVPSDPVRLDSGAYFVWPLRQAYGDIPALTATAQPITRIVVGGRTVVLFAAIDGIAVEVQLEGVSPELITGATTRVEGELVIAHPVAALGLGCEMTVGDTTLVFLDRTSAESVWRGEVDGRETLLLWQGAGWFDDGFTVVPDHVARVIDAFPPLTDASLVEREGIGTVFQRYGIPEAGDPLAIPVGSFDATPLVPVRRGGPAQRLSAPTDADFADAASLAVTVPEQAFDGIRSVLALEWRGDVIRAYIGDRLVADQFWYGRPFEIDLTPHRDALRTQPLILRAFAWAPGSEVYVDPRVRPLSDSAVLEVISATVSSIRPLTLR